MLKVDAVLFDLDDTLYAQSDWLDGAWKAVAAAAAVWDVDAPLLHGELATVAADRGSAGGRIIDDALERIGARHVPVTPLVAAFRAYRPPQLNPYPGVYELLSQLGSSHALGVVTDGEPSIQAAKMRALGLHERFDVIVCSDTLGRHRRKPHAAPFRAALAALGVVPSRAVFVGDHPLKDVAGPQALGVRAIRVRSGEYAEQTGVTPWATVETIRKAGAILLGAQAEGG